MLRQIFTNKTSLDMFLIEHFLKDNDQKAPWIL